MRLWLGSSGARGVVGGRDSGTDAFEDQLVVTGEWVPDFICLSRPTQVLVAEKAIKRAKYDAAEKARVNAAAHQVKLVAKVGTAALTLATGIVSSATSKYKAEAAAKKAIVAEKAATTAAEKARHREAVAKSELVRKVGTTAPTSLTGIVSPATSKYKAEAVPWSAVRRAVPCRAVPCRGLPSADTVPTP